MLDIVMRTRSGRNVNNGDLVSDFRGESFVYRGVSRVGRTGTVKVVVEEHHNARSREYNASVFGLTMDEEEEA